MKSKISTSVVVAIICIVFDASAQTTAFEFTLPSEVSLPPRPKGFAVQEGKLQLSETCQRLPKNVGNGLNRTNFHLADGTSSSSSPWV